MLLSKLETSDHCHGNENFDDAQITTRIPVSPRSATGDLSTKGKKSVVVHRRRLSKRSTANKNTIQNGAVAILSSGEKSSNKTAASISKAAIDQQERLALSATTAGGGREKPMRKVSHGKISKSGREHVENHASRKKIPSYRNNQVDEMRDDREEKKRQNNRSPVGIKLRLNDMVLEPAISDLTSIPSLRVQSTYMNEKRDEHEAKVYPAQELMQEGNVIHSQIIHKNPTSISLDETFIRRGQTSLAETPDRRRVYRSSYMREIAVRHSVERGIGNTITNSDGEEETVYSSAKYKTSQIDKAFALQGIRGARTSNQCSGIAPSCTDDYDHQTYHKEALKGMRVLPQQTIAEIPVQKKKIRRRVAAAACSHSKKYREKGHRGIVSIPPDLTTHFELSKFPEETAPHIYASEVGPVIIAESCSIQGQSNEQPMNNSKLAQGGDKQKRLLSPSFESAMRHSIKLEPEGKMNDKYSVTYKSHKSENQMGNEYALASMRDLYLTKICKKGKWRRLVSRQIGLKRDRSLKKRNEEINPEGKKRQGKWINLFGFRRARLSSALASISQAYRPPVHNHLEIASTAPMKTKGEVKVTDVSVGAENTRDSEVFTTSGIGTDFKDFLSFGLCGLRYMTCMLTEEDQREKRIDSSPILNSNRNHMEVIGSNLSSSSSLEESHSSRTESSIGLLMGSKEGNGRDSRPKPSVEEFLSKFHKQRSSMKKETETRLLKGEMTPQVERSVRFGPIILSDASPSYISPFNQSSALIPGCCIPTDANELDGNRCFPMQKRTRKHNQLVPVTREMMDECNEFFRDRKELKGDQKVPVENDITSTSALKGSLLRVGAKKLSNLTKPGGLIMRPIKVKPRSMSTKKSQERNWRLMKSLLDDDSSFEKEGNSRSLKSKKMGNQNELWAVKLFR